MARSIELSFVGDVVLGRYRGEDGEQTFREMAPPDADPLRAVAGLLAADVVVGNLESPVRYEAPAHPTVPRRFAFGASAAHLSQLVRGGFTVMSLANNHAFDLGVDGQLEGPAALAELGIAAIGASRTDAPLLRVETVEVEGWRVGFMAFSTLTNHPGVRGGPRLPLVTRGQIREQALPLLAAARDDHDLLIVVVHWGTEYAEEVRQANRLVARALLDGGVDLLVGHHPHVLQAVELHRSGEADAARDGLIAYSMGNFMFPRGDVPPALSAVLRVRFGRCPSAASEPAIRLSEAPLHPVFVTASPAWAPTPAQGHRAQQVRARLTRLSQPHGTTLTRADEPSEDLVVEGLRGCPSGAARDRDRVSAIADAHD